MTDIEIVREAIELFMVNYFDTIEMSGSVKQQKKGEINYLSVDLKTTTWDENIDKLNHSLTKYLTEWGKINLSNFTDYVSIASLTIEYLLPEKEGANQNQSRHIKLFYLPSYYFDRKQKNENGRLYPKFFLKVLSIWYNILLRNTILTAIPTILLILISLYKIQYDSNFEARLIKSYDYINVASGIIASFVLGFIINKVINIRQDKLKYTRTIRTLSNKLTYFRNICYNLGRDHNFWTKDKPFYESYRHATSIKNEITFVEYSYPNYDDDIEYAKFKSFYDQNMSHSVVSLILQLHMMADETFLDSGLTYTDFPPNYIYSHDEMERFILFNETNQIWYCCSELKIFPETFNSSYYAQKIVADFNRIYPKSTIKELTRDKLEEVSLDFQYRIIPQLYKLTKLVSSKLPITIKYFVTTFTLLISFGLIIPTLTYIFIDKTYAFLSVFAVIGIICHILLTLKPILRTENTLDKKDDYL